MTLAGDRAIEGLGLRVPLPGPAAASTTADLAVHDDADLLTWDLAVTAEPGQVMTAPGQQIAASDGERPTFRFRSEIPGVWNLHIATARYAVAKTNAGPVQIEIYHHPRHTWNIKVYSEAARFALDELTRRFGPYPHRVVRLVETPHLLLSEEDTAITNANTIFIPEHGGWIHDYRKPPAFDWIQYQVARDVSRAWWGQQVVPARAQGASLITNGLPGLSGMLVLEARHTGAGTRQYRNVLADDICKIALWKMAGRLR